MGKRTSSWITIATTLALLGGSAATAAGPVAKSFDAVDARSTADFWTAARLANAKAMPLPSVDLDSIFDEDARLLEVADRIDAALSGASGAPPRRGMKPDFSRRDYSLSDITEPDSAAWDDLEPHLIGKGTPRGHFSSSRLIPGTANTTYPYSAVGKLFFSQPGVGEFVCSGAVIRPRLVLTAGHCVHSGSDGTSGFFTNFSFRPGFRSGVSPFFAHAAAYVIVAGAWATGGGVSPNAGDWALIETSDISGVRIGTRTGYFGYQFKSLMPNHVTALGYPANLDSGQEMHQVNAQPFKAAAPNTALFGSDMRGGSSGGPIVMNFGECASGQAACTTFNRIVSAISYGPIATNLAFQGGSVFQTSGDGNFQQLISMACAHRADNC